MGAHKIIAVISGVNKPGCKGDIKFLSSTRMDFLSFFVFCTSVSFAQHRLARKGVITYLLLSCFQSFLC